MGGVVVGAAAAAAVAAVVVVVHLSLLFVDFHAQSLSLLKCDNSIACTRHIHMYTYIHTIFIYAHTHTHTHACELIHCEKCKFNLPF